MNTKNILVGHDGLMELCQLSGTDVILNAIVGYNGLEPTLEIIESGIDIALSNKESIVQAGSILMRIAKDKKLNTHVWYDEKTLLLLKVSYKKLGLWEYRLKNYK